VTHPWMCHKAETSTGSENRRYVRNEPRALNSKRSLSTAHEPVVRLIYILRKLDVSVLSMTNSWAGVNVGLRLTNGR
jgi:hypothetical protein